MFGKAANRSSISEELISDKQLMFRCVAQHGPIFLAVFFSLSSPNMTMDLHVPLLLLSETVGSGSP